ncbi:rhamnosyltransferase WsaF family glycosyltransferase [Actibacterium lipolyticum]|uniref:Glycosyl transferase family 2 n=1 Tax=Actibacterium lipolyticum TaxID=1524263 RepID=A0A238KV27_9RHOB|nr:glycosyltransferase [Actibacterium lipolyticum]SMX45896.1 Glycosyl transferase family 2 [Actibacterium lipolyticum]
MAKLNISKLKKKMVEVREYRSLKRHFDYGFYREKYPDLQGLKDSQLLTHYCVFGWKEMRDPSASFSTSGYIQANPDVALARVNPFLHYINFGKEEGREGLPLTQKHLDLENLAPHFDASYYRENSPDIAGYNDQQLLEHFYQYGWKEGRDPNANFSVAYYLRQNPDVREAKVNPLLHYVTGGESEQRPVAAPAPRRWTQLNDDQMALIAKDFDADFYRQSGDVPQGNDRELLEHYLREGWEEGRDPNRTFSTGYYLDTYRDIQGVCPFIHYVLHGRKEGRRTNESLPIHLERRDDAVFVPEHLNTIQKRPASDAIPPVVPTSVNPKCLDIHWVIPDFSKGSGGHMTIFRTVRFLESFGHRCTIWIENPVFHKTGDEAYQNIVKFFQCVEAEVRFVDDGFFETSGDVVIATGWSTAYLVNVAQGFAGKYYFVQDHEPEFYPTGAESLLARKTYDFDFACICASPWLEQKMHDTYGRWSRSFYLGYDHNVYKNIRDLPSTERKLTLENGRKKIAVYAREHTTRRAVHLALMALKILAEQRDDFEVHFFGQDDLPFDATTFESFQHGVKTMEELSTLYNECDLGVCFSATNYSLVPQEMMACGLPLIELDVESTNAIFPEGIVTLAGPDPQDIAAKIGQLLDDEAAAAAQQEKALDWVKDFVWESAARNVETAIVDYLEQQQTEFADTEVDTTSILLDVVIPTYNGMGELEPVIDALRNQRIRDRIKIHCVDSSSSDGTTEWLKEQSDISLTVIDQKDFQHGRTRNFGASLGTAPFIAFLTQDAIPAHEDWATDIVKMLRHYPDAAGIFGRHLPYPDHPLFVRQEIENHFKNMEQFPLALSRDTDPEKWGSGDRGWRQLLHFYSDNNSAMRRTIWENIPYAEVDYGEDQVWARDIVEAGYTKLYAPTATVYHSHDFTPEQTYKRCKIEGAFFFEHFGYELGEGTDEQLATRIEMEQKSVQQWANRYHISAEEIAMRQANVAEKYRGWKDGRLQAQSADA